MPFFSSANVSFSIYQLALLCTAVAKPEFGEFPIFWSRQKLRQKSSYMLLAQFHLFCKDKCYKQQKGRKLLRDAGKYCVSKHNRLYTDKTCGVCAYTVMWSKLPIITWERDLEIITRCSLKALNWILRNGRREKQCQGWIQKKQRKPLSI